MSLSDVVNTAEDLNNIEGARQSDNTIWSSRLSVIARKKIIKKKTEKLGFQFLPIQRASRVEWRAVGLRPPLAPPACSRLQPAVGAIGRRCVGDLVVETKNRDGGRDVLFLYSAFLVHSVYSVSRFPFKPRQVTAIQHSTETEQYGSDEGSSWPLAYLG